MRAVPAGSAARCGCRFPTDTSSRQPSRGERGLGSEGVADEPDRRDAAAAAERMPRLGSHRDGRGRTSPGGGSSGAPALLPPVTSTSRFKERRKREKRSVFPVGGVDSVDNRPRRRETGPFVPNGRWTTRPRLHSRGPRPSSRPVTVHAQVGNRGGPIPAAGAPGAGFPQRCPHPGPVLHQISPVVHNAGVRA